MLLNLTFLTLFGLATGVFNHLALMPQVAVGRRYFLYHGFGALAVVVVMLWIHPVTLPLAGAYVALSFIGCWVAGRSPRVSQVCLFVASIAGAWVIFQSSGGNDPSAILSALLLGHTFGNMCLGHWYLNVPKLSIHVLRRATLILFALLAVRLLYSTYWLFQAYDGLTWLLSSTVGLFWLMRYFWGLVAPILLFYFLWDTVRLSSTQSATGLYYVMVVMVLVGEIVSLYLLIGHGVAS